MESIAKNEIKVKKTLRQNGKTVSIYEVIRNPELVYWRTGYSDPKQFGYFNDLSKKINKAIPECDGKNGRPTPMEALSFYHDVLVWGGGVYFTNAIHTRSEEEGIPYLRTITPEGVSRPEWMELVFSVIEEYCTIHLIPNTWNEKEREGNTDIEIFGKEMCSLSHEELIGSTLRK